MKERKHMGYVTMMVSLAMDAPEHDEHHYMRAVDYACKAGALQVDRLFERAETSIEGIVARRYTMWKWEWLDEAEAERPLETVAA